MSVKEVAQYLTCHEMTIRKLIAKREIPFIKKKGLGIRLRLADLNRWLEKDLHSAEGWAANP
jgi:excisionase family DNA binding protein